MSEPTVAQRIANALTIIGGPVPLGYKLDVELAANRVLAEVPELVVQRIGHLAPHQIHPGWIRQVVREALGLSTQGVAQAERLEAEKQGVTELLPAPPEPAARPEPEELPEWFIVMREAARGNPVANDWSSITDGEKWIEANLREREELRDKQCHHGWRGVDELGVIRTPCPACGGQLFIGKGGHLTCSVIKCGHDPGIEHYWNDYKTERDKLRTAARELKEAERNPTDQGPHEEADFWAAVESVCAVVDEIDRA